MAGPTRSDPGSRPSPGSRAGRRSGRARPVSANQVERVRPDLTRAPGDDVADLGPVDEGLAPPPPPPPHIDALHERINIDACDQPVDVDLVNQRVHIDRAINRSRRSRSSTAFRSMRSSTASTSIRSRSWSASTLRVTAGTTAPATRSMPAPSRPRRRGPRSSSDAGARPRPPSQPTAVAGEWHSPATSTLPA